MSILQVRNTFSEMAHRRQVADELLVKLDECMHALNAVSGGEVADYKSFERATDLAGEIDRETQGLAETAGTKFDAGITLEWGSYAATRRKELQGIIDASSNSVAAAIIVSRAVTQVLKPTGLHL